MREEALHTLHPHTIFSHHKRVSEEEGLEAVKEFLETSCRNHGNCDKVYDSWIRAALRGAASKGIKPRGLKSWQEKDPELFALIRKVLDGRSTNLQPLDLTPT